jgi:hypothetical protein
VDDEEEDEEDEEEVVVVEVVAEEVMEVEAGVWRILSKTHRYATVIAGFCRTNSRIRTSVVNALCRICSRNSFTLFSTQFRARSRFRM